MFCYDFIVVIFKGSGRGILIGLVIELHLTYELKAFLRKYKKKPNYAHNFILFCSIGFLTRPHDYSNSVRRNYIILIRKYN